LIQAVKELPKENVIDYITGALTSGFLTQNANRAFDRRKMYLNFWVGNSCGFFMQKLKAGLTCSGYQMSLLI
jgi:hypothetical protein